MSDPQDEGMTDDDMLSWRRPAAPQDHPTTQDHLTTQADPTASAASEQLDWSRARQAANGQGSGGVEHVHFPTHRRGPEYVDPYATAPTSGHPTGGTQDPWAYGSAASADSPAGATIGLDPAHHAPHHATHRRRRTGVGIAVVAAVATGAAVALVGGNIADGSTQPNSTLGRMAGTNRTTPMTTEQVATAVTAGIVDINTTLGFQNASAAGTGMVLTSDGEILTNNHVVRGATSLSVTVVTTGKTYSAKVVGTDAADDVAVIKLNGAHDLATVPISTASVSVGNSVVAIGNAGGKGGAPSVVTGQVTGVDQSITASDEGGTNAETLTGLIQVDAPIVSGDSGGALANTYGNVIGMNTAASSNNENATMTGGGSVGYAIPIKKALTIADKIENGEASSTIHIGGQAFLGIGLAPDPSSRDQEYGFSPGSATGSGVTGALVQGTTQGNSPAADAGVSEGDTVTSVDGKAVSSGTKLKALLDTYKPGDKIQLGWTDSEGTAHTATVTLAEGPAA